VNRRKFISSFIAFGMGTPVSAETSETRNIKLERYGDVAQIGIPVSGLLLAVGKKDGEGARQALEGAFWNSVLTLAIKHGLNAERPNGGNLSFPSGHTSNATQGAAFIFFRYGPKIGVIAFAAAALVGYSRVENNYHYWRDVFAGMALATGIQYLVTKKLWSVTAFTKKGS
jgi:membrane-associated phospholipid phosphatase